jgi:hypothetical protein
MLQRAATVGYGRSARPERTFVLRLAQDQPGLGRSLDIPAGGGNWDVTRGQQQPAVTGRSAPAGRTQELPDRIAGPAAHARGRPATVRRGRQVPHQHRGCRRGSRRLRGPRHPGPGLEDVTLTIHLGDHITLTGPAGRAWPEHAARPRVSGPAARRTRYSPEVVQVFSWMWIKRRAPRSVSGCTEVLSWLPCSRRERSPVMGDDPFPRGT